MRSLQPRTPVPALSEIAQSIPSPLYLRRVELIELPALPQPKDVVWPQSIVIVQHEPNSAWSTACKKMGKKSKTHILQLHENRDKSIKKLLSWLVTMVQNTTSKTSEESGQSILFLDGLALSSLWNQQPPEQAAVAISTLRLELIQAVSAYIPQMRWLAWTQMGSGAFGQQDHSKQSDHAKPATPDMTDTLSHNLLLGGATLGFFKSLAREWNIPCRCVDVFDVSQLPSLVEIINTELSDDSDIMEIVYDRGTRFTPILAEEEHGSEILRPWVSQIETRPVIAISAGAMGITARIVEALAQHLSFRALILGRTPCPDPAQALPLSDKAQTRRILRERLDNDATPKQLQEALKQAEKQAQLAQQLRKFESLGVECLYIPTDLDNALSVQRAVQEAVQRWGRVDAVFHGAGIDQSRDLMQKTGAEMEQVMGVKIRGLAHLRRALADQPIRAWLGLSSVSARFGNTGQIDYAAANEAMTRWLLGDPHFAHSLVLDYTGWEDVGMAASLAKFMKERGVDMLPVDTTASHTAALWLTGTAGEWVYAGRLPSALDSTHPLGQVTSRIPGREVRYRKALHTGQELFLQDHKMGDTEIQPGVVSLAWMQHSAEEVSQGVPCGEIRQISFLRALKIFPKHSMLMDVQAQRVGQHTPSQIHARVDTERTRRGLQEHTHHASATFLPGPCTSVPEFAEELMRWPESNVVQDPSLHNIYETFFHGPTWQVLGQAGWNETICIASTPASCEHLGQGLPHPLRFRAVAQELALQAAGLWALRQHHTFVLPFGIQTLYLLEKPPAQECYQTKLRFLRRDGDDFVFEGVILGREGRLLQAFDGLRMRIFPLS